MSRENRNIQEITFELNYIITKKKERKKRVSKSEDKIPLQQSISNFAFDVQNKFNYWNEFLKGISCADDR